MVSGSAQEPQQEEMEGHHVPQGRGGQAGSPPTGEVPLLLPREEEESQEKEEEEEEEKRAC